MRREPWPQATRKGGDLSPHSRSTTTWIHTHGLSIKGRICVFCTNKWNLTGLFEELLSVAGSPKYYSRCPMTRVPKYFVTLQQKLKSLGGRCGEGCAPPSSLWIGVFCGNCRRPSSLGHVALRPAPRGLIQHSAAASPRGARGSRRFVV